jgi:peptide/nickel transport system permease protein
MTRLSRWLLSPTPSSQWQARMGRMTFAVLDFAASPAAMAGLAIVLLLIFVAAFALESALVWNRRART